MKTLKITLVILNIAIVLYGCLTAGTHGSIKAYTFPVAKNILQRTVKSLIEQDSNIRIAPIRDTFTSKYYNDGERYVTIEIGSETGYNEYTFQYTGEKEYWDTAGSSEISIAYAYDKNGKGGSMGNGRFSSSQKETRRVIIDVFEKEFIDKIDSILKYRRQLQ